MKRLFFIMVLFVSTNLYAQYSQSSERTFNIYNSDERSVIKSFEKDSQGFFVENPPKRNISEAITGIPYAYDKKNDVLYVKSEWANYSVILKKVTEKIYKKDDNIPKLKNEELINAIEQVNSELSSKCKSYNDNRTKELAEEAARIKKEQEEKRIKDSLEKVRLETEFTNYRKTHNWMRVPTGGNALYCTDCKESYNKDIAPTLLIRNDSIYYGEVTEGYLDLTYVKYHVASIPESMKNNADFKIHYSAFRDSLQNNRDMDKEYLNVYNSGSLLNYLDELKKEAPYGFLLSWGWNSNSVNGIEPNFAFMNMAKKTIKYVDFYFSVYNDVGDRCYLDFGRSSVGHVRGVGPVESLESGSWSWDSPTHYTSADASEMRIVKLVLTYMDGTTRTIPKASLKID